MTTITASGWALQRNPDGSYNWQDGVTLSGYAANGSLAQVAYSSEFIDHGYGVLGPGSRWSQIDYIRYDGGWGPDGNGVWGGSSEALIVDFNGKVTNATMTVGMVGNPEGKIDGNKILPETGKWTAYRADGSTIASGDIGPDKSTLGPGVKIPGTYGAYPMKISVNEPIASLRIEATEFGYGRASHPGFFKLDDSSDFSLTSLSYTRVSTDGGSGGGSGGGGGGSGGSTGLTGTAGNNRLVGTSGNDKMYGLAGIDTLDGAAGNDTLSSGSGNDHLLFKGTAFGHDTITDLGDKDLMQIGVSSSLASYLGGKVGGTGMVVSNGVLWVYGESVDKLASIMKGYGGAGAGSHSDGDDLVIDFNANSSITFEGMGDGSSGGGSGGDGGGSTGGGGSSGGSGSTLKGTAGNNRLTGTNGDDQLFGYAGIDTLDGGAGSDTITSGSGNDHLLFKGTAFGDDTITDLGDKDLMQIGVSSSLASYLGGKVGGTGMLVNNGVLWAYGESVDKLASIMKGYGGAGAGSHSDGDDLVIDFNANSSITFEGMGDGSSGGGGSTGGGGSSGGSGSTLKGTAGNNRLIGTSGDDQLFGYAGIDTLDGGAGDDSLTSGSSSDHLLFKGSAFGDDTVTDMGGTDLMQIDVDPALASYLGAKGGGTGMLVNNGVLWAYGSSVDALASIMKGYGGHGTGSHSDGDDLVIDFNVNSSITFLDFV